MLYKEKAIAVEKKKSRSGSTYSTYSFKCIECDNTIRAQVAQLKTHTGKCRRCTQKGLPYIHIYNELIKSNVNRNLQVTLSYEEFLELIKSSNCHYCDSNLIFNKHTRDEEGNHISRAYQLDRKDNTIGYTISNCVTCCWECNRLKSNKYSYDEFILFKPILKQIIKSREEL